MCELYGKGDCVHATASGHCNGASKICASCAIGSRYEKKVGVQFNHMALIRELSAFADSENLRFQGRYTPPGYEVYFGIGNYGLKRCFTIDDLKEWAKLSKSIEDDVKEWLEKDVPSEAMRQPSRGLGKSFAYDMCFSNAKEVINNMYGKPVTIKEVIFNKPATIVFWSDGTKTVVKVQGKSKFDKEKGLAMAISKKFLGNKGNYYNEFKKHLGEEE